MARRIILFLVTNLVVMVVGSIVISFVMNLMGLDYSHTGEANYTSLMVWCGLWGMLGSMISLFLSKTMAKMYYRVQIVDDEGQYTELVSTIHKFAREAGLSTMPEVGVYPSDEINAFATGRSRNNSMVAVSEGLLRRMSTDEVEGVLAHEVAHIANGDMVTMALVQGIVNAFVLFLSEIATRIVDNFFKDEDGRGGLGFFGYFIVRNLLYAAFGLLTAPIVFWFSRFREYRADSGGAKLAGKNKMLAALQGLQVAYPTMLADETESKSESRGKENFRTMQISSAVARSELFSTHPSLEKRIQALKEHDFKNY